MVKISDYGKRYITKYTVKISHYDKSRSKTIDNLKNMVYNTNMRARARQKHNGFWIRAFSIYGDQKDITGFRSLPDIELALKSYGPQIIRIEAHIANKMIKVYERVKGSNLMGKFTNFAQENPNTNYAPFADGAVKEALCAFKIPFNIVSSKTVESTKFTNTDGSPQTSIWYNIELDKNADTFAWAKKVSAIESAYTLQLPDSPRRQKQWSELIKPEIDQNGFCRVCLTKRGKAYDFDDAE